VSSAETAIGSRNPNGGAVTSMAASARIAITVCAVVCSGCMGRAGRAADYPPGTPFSTVVSEIGKPDRDNPYAEHDGWFGDPATHLCIDESNRVLKVLHSVS
jgi:hypothetical protein